MLTRQKRLRRHVETPELDVTPFMNLMIVLVPVLLLSMVFVHTTVIELNFPSVQAGGEAQPEDIRLEIRIEADALVVADQRGIIKRLPVMAEGDHDYDGLGAVMREVKRRVPEKRDATILLAPDTHYQTLVSVMDVVRLQRQRAGDEWVSAELFPDISLGDTAKGGAI